MVSSQVNSGDVQSDNYVMSSRASHYDDDWDEIPCKRGSLFHWAGKTDTAEVLGP